MDRQTAVHLHGLHSEMERHHDAMAECHKGLAEHFKMSSPGASDGHTKLADLHERRADYHKCEARALAAEHGFEGDADKATDLSTLRKMIGVD